MVNSLENPLDRNMLESAVFQQLFLGSKRIQGKNPEHTMQLTGVESLLNDFIDDLEKNLSLIEQFKIQEFINYFSNRFNVDFEATYTRIMNNLNAMGGVENLKGQETVVIYIVLTKLIEALREYAYSQWGKKRIEDDFTRKSNKKFGNKEIDHIQHLAAIGDGDISLLYNLSFISMLSHVYGSKKFQTTIKRLISMRVNRILKSFNL
ncbi:MAG: hypothetical protein K9W44_03165 [Candidatus Lokiarchaeota archaeon]|nr:hypothetical protein [Candidatus Harpocratesius repetitus]